jgi:hypothetical protein
LRNLGKIKVPLGIGEPKTHDENDNGGVLEFSGAFLSLSGWVGKEGVT